MCLHCGSYCSSQSHPLTFSYPTSYPLQRHPCFSRSIGQSRVIQARKSRNADFEKKFAKKCLRNFKQTSKFVMLIPKRSHNGSLSARWSQIYLHYKISSKYLARIFRWSLIFFSSFFYSQNFRKIDAFLEIGQS